MTDNYQDCTLLHIDADGFFAAVEQALNPSWRGRPVVTGAERGIIAAASYEAKALGIKRGLQLHEARRLCPDLVVVPSDYEAYSLYSQRLFAILRRFTPLVEEYSIDEAFASLQGCASVLAAPLETVAERLRRTMAAELGATVSVGISLTKTLAKLCSKFRKPDGQTIVRREHIPLLLRRTPIAQVWRIGPASAACLQAQGVATAHDFYAMDEAAVLRLLHKPGWETWRELHGRQMLPLDTSGKWRYETMTRGHTFAPPNADRDFIYSEALLNLTTVLARLRRHHHLAREIGLALRFKDYRCVAATAALPSVTSHDAEAVPVLRALFTTLFQPACLYRSTTVWLAGLEARHGRQGDLFEETPRRRALERLDTAVDNLRQRYGQAAVTPAARLDGARKPIHPRDARPRHRQSPLPGEYRRRLALPRMELPPPP